MSESNSKEPEFQKNTLKTALAAFDIIAIEIHKPGVNTVEEKCGVAKHLIDNVLFNELERKH